MSAGYVVPKELVLAGLAAMGSDRGVRTDAQRLRAALAAVLPLAIAAERERCARVAEGVAADYDMNAQQALDNLRNMHAAERFAYRKAGAERAAAAIRRNTT